MARRRAPRVLAYSDGMFVGPPASCLINGLVTHSDGRPRARQGQAEWQKAGELTRDTPSVLAGSREAAMRAAFPASAARRTGGAPIARRENSVAAVRELAGSAGG